MVNFNTFAPLQDTFSSYILIIISLLTVTIIVNIYILLTLPLAGHSFEDSYKEYLAMILFLVGLQLSYIIITNGCHNGKWQIG